MTVPPLDLDALRQAVHAASVATSSADLSEVTSSEELLQAREVLLLRQTLQYAFEQVPYYRELFDQTRFSVQDFRRASDLRALPILTRPTVVERLKDLVSRNVRVTTITSTSGTTSAVRLPRFVSDEEQEACSLLHRLELGDGDERSQNDIVLRLFPAMRRYMPAGSRGGAPQIVVTLSLHYPKYSLRLGFDDFVIRQLFEPVPIPGTAERVTVIHATPPFLMRILTDEMRARSLSPRDTSVRVIACSGGLVTTRIRSAVEQDWGVPLVTSYSLSELNAVAVECPSIPQRYHWDAGAYVEVLDPGTLEPVPVGGEGLLVLTSLYPFQQAQPFIRYNSGDLARYEGRECTCGFVGTCIDFLGRAEHCVDLHAAGATGRRFVASAVIHDVLEDCNEVPSLLHPKFEIARLDQSNGTVELRLRLEVFQIANAAMVEALRTRIIEALRGRYPTWEPLVRAGRLRWDVQIYNRGELNSFFKMYPES